MVKIQKKTAETTNPPSPTNSQNQRNEEAMDLDGPLTSLEDIPKRPAAQT
jgi:hypothetical protein